MKRTLVLLIAGILAGCGQATTRVFQAERIADGKADALASGTWGKIEYAPKQYAGFAYDSTGVYGNLHGQRAPELIRLRLHAAKDGKSCFRTLYLPSLVLDGGSPAGSMTHLVVPDVGLKWLGRGMIACRPSVYGRSFWIPWKAFELDGPPTDGKVSVYVGGMRRQGKGARFLLGGDDPRGDTEASSMAVEPDLLSRLAAQTGATTLPAGAVEELRRAIPTRPGSPIIIVIDDSLSTSQPSTTRP